MVGICGHIWPYLGTNLGIFQVHPGSFCLRCDTWEAGLWTSVVSACEDLTVAA